MATNCLAERSFSQLKWIKNPNGKIMRQEKFDSSSSLTIEADFVCKINFDGIIKDFARHRCRKKNFKM